MSLPDGTYLVGYSKREIALCLLAARQHLSDTANAQEYRFLVQIPEEELDELVEKLNELFAWFDKWKKWVYNETCWSEKKKIYTRTLSIIPHDREDNR